jgi:pimeloyl-ACP methyl ester carboxylesterase
MPKAGADTEGTMKKKQRVGSGLAVYLPDIRRAYERVQSKGTDIRSPFGNIQYTEGGSGPPVLVIHGSGGGYDQGELIVQTVLSEEFHWITPSRFGYLQSTYREGATWEDQAHAYAFLLDQLQIEKVAVVALSQGGPSALLFAVLYPERVSSLTLVSCGVTSAPTHEQVGANQKGNMLVKIYKRDLNYWVITKLFKKFFLRLMGADDAVITGLTSQQRYLVDSIINYMNPVSLRSAGVAFDNQARLPGDRIRTIQAPTLIVHASDDTLQLYHNAEFAVATIPDAKLVQFEKGGHLLMVVEQSTVAAAVQKHIIEHTNT